MELVYPIAYDIKIKQIDEENWELNYTEVFDKSRPDLNQVIDNTMEIWKNKLGQYLPTSKIKRKDNKMTIVTTHHSQAIFSALVLEFLGKTPLGEMKFMELLATVALL